MKGKQYASIEEEMQALFYESVRILRDNDHFKVYLQAVEESMEATKEGLLRCKTMEDVIKLQMYYTFLSDLLRYAYAEEPNPEPAADDGE